MVFETLLKHSPKEVVMHRTAEGETLLHYVAMKPTKLSMAKATVEAGVDPHAVTAVREGDTSCNYHMLDTRL